jgi:hypothetical protein
MKVTTTSEGQFFYNRLEASTDFLCQRCNSRKKAKIIVKWKTTAGEEKTICNGCYGLLLSKNAK